MASPTHHRLATPSPLATVPEMGMATPEDQSTRTRARMHLHSSSSSSAYKHYSSSTTTEDGTHNAIAMEQIGKSAEKLQRALALAQSMKARPEEQPQANAVLNKVQTALLKEKQNSKQLAIEVERYRALLEQSEKSAESSRKHLQAENKLLAERLKRSEEEALKNAQDLRYLKSVSGTKRNELDKKIEVLQKELESNEQTRIAMNDDYERKLRDLKSLHKHQVDDYKAKLQEGNMQVEQLKRDAARLQQNLATAEKEATALRAQKDSDLSKPDALDKLTLENITLKRQKENLENEVRVLTKRCDDTVELRSTITKLKRDLTLLQADLEEERKRTHTLRDIEAEADRQRRRIASLESDLDHASQKKRKDSELESQLGKLKRQNSVLSSDLQQHKTREGELESSAAEAKILKIENKKLAAQLASATDKIGSLENSLTSMKSLESKVKELQSCLEKEQDKTSALNMKVSDTTELQERIRTLEETSKTATRLEQEVIRLQEENNTLRAQYITASNDNANLRPMNEKLQQQLSQIMDESFRNTQDQGKEIAKLQSAVHTLTLDNAHLRDELNAQKKLTAKMDSLTMEKQSMERQIATMTEDLRDAKEKDHQIRDLRHEIAKLKTERDRMKGTLEAEREANYQLSSSRQDQTEALRRQLNAMEDALTESQIKAQQADRLKIENESMRNDLLELKKEQADGKSKCEEEKRKLRARIAELEEEVQELRRQLEELRNENFELVQENEGLQQNNAKLEEKVDELKNNRPPSPSKPKKAGGMALADVSDHLNSIFGGRVTRNPNTNMFTVVGGDGRKYLIKLAGGQLIIRVGGGWQQLELFLKSHRSDLSGAPRRKASIDRQLSFVDAHLQGVAPDPLHDKVQDQLQLGSKYTSPGGAQVGWSKNTSYQPKYVAPPPSSGKALGASSPKASPKGSPRIVKKV